MQSQLQPTRQPQCAGLCPGCCIRTECQQRPRLLCRAQATQTASRPQLQQKLKDLAGSKNGLDRTVPQRVELNKAITALEAEAGEVPKPDLTGTHWQLVCTNSQSSSGGKLGPFIGYVEQDFPADQPGRYINKVDFGALRAYLGAKYFYENGKKIRVKFEYINFVLGSLNFRREFGNQGTWEMTYVSDDLRILYTNRGNVFCLEKIPAPKIAPAQA